MIILLRLRCFVRKHFGGFVIFFFRRSGGSGGLNFVRGLSLQDGLSTLTDFTATIIYQSIINSINPHEDIQLNILICGGGRKNISLVNAIKNKLPSNMKLFLIDDFKINGDFVESQAFAYLAIRSYLKKIISFPKTTNVKNSCSGGTLVENY